MDPDRWIERWREDPRGWLAKMRESFGEPIYGIAPDSRAVIKSYGAGGIPCNRVHFTYRYDGGEIKVFTATMELTEPFLMMQLRPLGPSIPPDVLATERTVPVPVNGAPTAFRVMHASTGRWVAVGSVEARNVLLVGSPETTVEGLSLARFDQPGA